MPDISGELEDLRNENARLRKLLKLTNAEAAAAHGTQAAWFDKSPGPVDTSSSPQAKVGFYAALFGARRDVYAIRWENVRYGKSGWTPAVAGGWRKGTKSADQHYLPLTREVLAAHLTGDVHIGLYPMLPGDQTCWLAADFDGPAAMLDALAYLKAARAIGAPAALEVSRSGVGAHVWVFFTDPVPAAAARRVGTGLVREAIAIRGRMDLRSYDRLFPSQDLLLGRGLGNLIAAPLHGKCRKIGTTVFLNLATLEPFEDQWDYLSSLERLTPTQVVKLAAELREPAVGSGVKQARPARSTRTQPNPAPSVHFTLDGGIRIPGSELSPSLYATLKHAASTYNPDFHDRQRRRQSTWNVPRIIPSYQETIDDHLILPRGLLERAKKLVMEAGSTVESDDHRAPGHPQEFTLDLTLQPAQRSAVDDILPHDLGLLVGPPGSGKTVMACAAIAARGLATLVLVDRKILATSGADRSKTFSASSRANSEVAAPSSRESSTSPRSKHSPDEPTLARRWAGTASLWSTSAITYQQPRSSPRYGPSPHATGSDSPPRPIAATDSMTSSDSNSAQSGTRSDTPMRTPSKVPTPTDHARCSSSTPHGSDWRSRSTCRFRVRSQASIAPWPPTAPGTSRSSSTCSKHTAADAIAWCWPNGPRTSITSPRRQQSMDCSLWSSRAGWGHASGPPRTSDWSPNPASLPLWSSPPVTSSAKASTAPLSTHSSSPDRSPSREDSSSTPAASCAHTPASKPPKSTTTTMWRCRCWPQPSPNAGPATSASASQTHGTNDIPTPDLWVSGPEIVILKFP